MLFGKYHIVILREGISGCYNLRIRSWQILLLLLPFLALMIANIWLLQSWRNDMGLKDSLTQNRQLAEEQQRQFLNLSGDVANISRDLQRVLRFDAKLRLMMNMESDPADAGAGLDEFSQVYLPMHRQELALRKMREYLDRLANATRLEEVNQQDLLRILRERRDSLANMPSIWPLNGFVTSSFGMRASPFGGSNRRFHKGLDIVSRVGTPRVAPAQGEVTMSAPDGAYGNSVEINHGSGIVTKYAHMQRCAVLAGQWVKRGEIVGYVGMSGRTTGPHLHYEVRLNGVPVNPMRYILD